MDVWIFALFSGCCALGAALLVYFVMQSRMEVLLSNQRERLAEAHATLEAQKEAMEGALKTVEETTRRKALDEFLSEIRIEERHHLREQRVLFMTRKSMVVRERIFFRNIPLSSWVEHEIAIDEGADLDKLARAVAVFTPEALQVAGKQISATGIKSFFARK
jgi:hypothetical protein